MELLLGANQKLAGEDTSFLGANLSCSCEHIFRFMLLVVEMLHISPLLLARFLLVFFVPLSSGLSSHLLGFLLKLSI